MRTRIATTFISTTLAISLRRAPSSHTTPTHTISMTTMIKKKVAVVYATKGGLGDAGKFAAAIAATDKSIEEARIVSLSRDSIEGGTHGISDNEIGVTDTKLCEKLRQDLATVTITHADIDDKISTSKVLESAFDGVDSVIACIGSRQPSFGRWISQGTELIIETMKKKDVKRLVILSSMGIGEDWIRFSFIKVIWNVMLSTMLRDARRDLTKMEELVRASGLDYLLVRPVGLTPGEAPKAKEQWKIAMEKDDIDFNIAKFDVGCFMVQQALNPTYSRTAVLFGSQPKM